MASYASRIVGGLRYYLGRQENPQERGAYVIDHGEFPRELTNPVPPSPIHHSPEESAPRVQYQSCETIIRRDYSSTLKPDDGQSWASLYDQLSKELFLSENRFYRAVELDCDKVYTHLLLSASPAEKKSFLQDAAQKSHHAALDILLRFDSKGEDVIEVFFESALRGDIPAMQLCYDRLHNVNNRNAQGETILDYLIRNSNPHENRFVNLRVLRWLLDHKLEVKKLDIRVGDSPWIDSTHPILRALDRHDYQAAYFLLDQGYCSFLEYYLLRTVDKIEEIGNADYREYTPFNLLLRLTRP